MIFITDKGHFARARQVEGSKEAAKAATEDYNARTFFRHKCAERSSGLEPFLRDKCTRMVPYCRFVFTRYYELSSICQLLTGLDSRWSIMLTSDSLLNFLRFTIGFTAVQEGHF